MAFWAPMVAGCLGKGPFLLAPKLIWIAIVKVFCNSSPFSGTMFGGNAAMMNPTNAE